MIGVIIMQMRNKYFNRLSKSKLLTFIDCPHKYYLSLNYPKEAKVVPAMVRGSELHDLFDKVYNTSYYKKDIEKDMLMKLLELDKDSKYEKEINKFMEWNKSRDFLIPESKEEKLYNKDLDTVTIIDRIDFDGENRLLLDYKSGKEKDLDDFVFELMFYVINYEMLKRKKIHYIGIYFIDTGVEKIMPVTEEMKKEAVHKFFEIKENLRDYVNQDVFPTKAIWKCRFCQWNHLCHHYIKYGK